jgi:hypothetical protein
MALLKITCPKCGHGGFVSSLPRLCCCCVCKHEALFHAGERVIRGESAPAIKPDSKPKPVRKRVLVAGEIRLKQRRQAAAEDATQNNLIEVLSKLDDDLDRIELWTAALSCFQHPAPEYQPDNDYLLPLKLDAHY